MNVLPILKSDFADICNRMANGNLKNDIEFMKKATVCKYVVPEGYGVKPISGCEIAVDVENIYKSCAAIYYANVDQKDGKLVTGTSRSVGIVGVADSIDEAERNCEKALKFVKCDHCFVRHDIGKKELVMKRVRHMKELRSA